MPGGQSEVYPRSRASHMDVLDTDSGPVRVLEVSGVPGDGRGG
jgi:hypothetical protein